MTKNPDGQLDLLALFGKNSTLSESALASIRAFMQRWSVSAFDALLECNVFSETQLAEMIAACMGVRVVTQIQPEQVSVDVLASIGYRDARNYGCLPLVSTKPNKKLVAIADPTRPLLDSMLNKALGKDFECVMVPLHEVIRAVDEYYPLAMQLPGMCQK